MLPQDACQARQRADVQEAEHGAASREAERRRTPLRRSTGLSPSGRLLSARSSQSSFYGVPLVAWTPVDRRPRKYDVEWSQTSNPWRAAGQMQTPATSALLPLTPGTWYYRVRGINPWLPGNKKLRWSGPVRVQIAKPTFSVSGG